jgi:tetratricopeptide (TPR) repeat protein
MFESSLQYSFDVFISYRRSTGAAYARLIQTALQKRNLRAFLDVTDLEQGYFDQALLERIQQTPYFVVVLSANCLDRCVDEGDWLRKEVACAISSKRTIVPVLLPKFEFPSNLPTEIQTLALQNGVPYSHEYFDGMVDKIVELFGHQVSWTRRWYVIAAISGVAILLLYLIVRIEMPRLKHPVAVAPTQQELTLQTEAQMLRLGHRFDEAIERDKVIVKMGGALANFAAEDITSIQNLLEEETGAMSRAKAAEEKRDWPTAEMEYQKAAGLHGKREMEAIESLNAVGQKKQGATDLDIAEGDLTNGIAAFKRAQYDTAHTYFNQALSRGPRNWPSRQQAQDYAQRATDRAGQQKTLSTAQQKIKERNYQGARDDAQKIILSKDPDPLSLRQAQDLVAQIPKDQAASNSGAVSDPKVESQVQNITSEANQLLERGQFKAAWDKARDIENLKRSATDLRQTIHSADENRFQELTSRYNSVDKRNRQDLLASLEALRQFQAVTVGRAAETAALISSAESVLSSLDLPTEPASQPRSTAAVQQLLPPISCKKEALSAGVGPKVQAGDTVSCAWLDEPLRWLASYPKPQPDAAGSVGPWTAMLMLKVDEKGHVVEVGPRGRANLHGMLDSLKTASGSWQTSAPTYQGRPVKAWVPLDLKFD